MEQDAFELIECDVNDTDEIIDVLDGTGVDAVIHLAAKAGATLY